MMKAKRYVDKALALFTKAFDSYGIQLCNDLYKVINGRDSNMIF